MINKGDMLTLEIFDTNIMGRGVAKCEELIIFCDGAVQGDTVIAFITDVKKNYAVAKALKVIFPSDKREKDMCPALALCGGCPLGHITYEHENQVKKKSIENAFRKTGHLKKEVSEIISVNEHSYRNKAVFHFNFDGTAGFYSPGTHQFINIENCGICHPKIIKIKSVCEEILKSNKKIEKNKLTYLYIRYMESTDEASVVIGYKGKEALSDAARTIASRDSSVKCIMRGKSGAPEERGESFEKLYEKSYIKDKFRDLDLMISPPSFYQVNHGAAEEMCGVIAGLADLSPKDVCIDLYCGIGTIGLCVAKSYPQAKIYGIEINRFAAENANKNAEENKISNASFFCGDSKDFKEKTGISRTNCIIVDPPRAGLSSETVEEILKFTPEKMIYISCNPSTLARDLCSFIKSYEISRVIGINMFPRTGHVETVVMLSRKNLSEKPKRQANDE